MEPRRTLQTSSLPTTLHLTLLKCTFHQPPSITFLFPYLSSPVKPQDTPRRHCFWHYASAPWDDLKKYFLLISCGVITVSCAAFACTQRITEVIVFRMEASITQFLPYAKTAWFSHDEERNTKMEKQQRTCESIIKTNEKLVKDSKIGEPEC